MRAVPLTTGDARRMAADDLYHMLEKVVDANQGLRCPYWILVIVKNHYQGPAAASAVAGVETTERTLPNKMIHNRIVAPLLRKPLVRQLGTMLWRVDNRRGQLDLEYALPMDVPTFVEDSANAGTVVGRVAEDAQGIPLMLS